MEAELRTRVENIVQKVEARDISDLGKLFAEWCDERQNIIDDIMRRLNIDKRKREIADRLLQLKDEEERLTFFEQLGKISLGMSRVPKVEETEVKEEEVFVAAPGPVGKRS